MLSSYAAIVVLQHLFVFIHDVRDAVCPFLVIAPLVSHSMPPSHTLVEWDRCSSLAKFQDYFFCHLDKELLAASYTKYGVSNTLCLVTYDSNRRICPNMTFCCLKSTLRLQLYTLT